jgi:hypothetical protein
LERLDTITKKHFNQIMQDPNYDEDGEPIVYNDEHELGHTPRSMDEVEPDHYLDSSVEDRNDIGGGYEF